MSDGKFLRQRNDWFVSLVSSALLFLVGATFTAISAASIVKGSASQNWGAIMGNISAIERRSDNRITSARYSYQYGNKTFKGDRICFGFSKTRGTSVLLGKRIGERVLIYVDPASPHQSTLLTGPDPRMKIMCGLSGIATLLGAAASWFLLGKLLGDSRQSS